MEKQELSAFQRNFNSLTFYLFLLSVKYEHLEDYDEDGPFENHYKKFIEIKNKLNEKIIDDKNLLINTTPFNEYYDSLFKLDFDKVNLLKEIKKNNKEFRYDKKTVQNLYFELSDTLSKSKIRTRAIQIMSWSVPVFSFAFIFLLFTMVTLEKWIELLFPLMIFIIAFSLLFYGLEKLIALKQKDVTKLKFNHMFSSDYCYRRIKESEIFFFNVYKINNDYFEIPNIELKFPEVGNLFERTINKTTLSKSNKEKLLIQNKNIFVRAVFSDFFKLLSEENRIEQLQQIPFMFIATLNKADIPVQGNTAFAECINHIFGKTIFTDVSFNQAKQKYTNEEDLFDKYRNILKKYENILQGINISSNQ